MKKIFLVTLLMISIFTVSCSSVKKQKEEFINEHSYYFEEDNIPDDWTWFDVDEYKKGLEKERFLNVSFKEIKEKIENGDEFTACFGFNPSLYHCPYCAICIPIAAMAAEENDLYIYYLDIYAMRQNNDEEYQWLYNYLVSEKDDFGAKILAPTYISFKDGSLVEYHVATLKKDDGSGYLKELSDEMKTELKNIFIDLLLIN